MDGKVDMFRSMIKAKEGMFSQSSKMGKRRIDVKGIKQSMKNRMADTKYNFEIGTPASLKNFDAKD
jgi:hypothetical protein